MEEGEADLAIKTGGLDWSSQTKIFPSLFPVGV